jgi:hypothetical protein
VEHVDSRWSDASLREAPESLAIDELRAEARRQFDAGDFLAATNALRRVEAQSLLHDADLELLVELLCDSADEEAALEVLERDWERRRAEDLRVSPRIAAIRFDLTVRLGRDETTRSDVAINLLSELVEAGDESIWNAIFTATRRAAIEGAFGDPFELLDVLAYEALAPESTGISTRAQARIEEIGLLAESPEIARSAEVVLHSLGAQQAAYRVERARKRKRSASNRRVAEPEAPPFRGLTIGVAGGHPAIRATIERFLLSSSAGEVRFIPSAKEATRSGRDIRATVSGCDVVVLLVRQLAHSTEAQIKRAGEQAGVPIVVAESSGIGGVQRALEEFAVRGVALEP